MKALSWKPRRRGDVFCSPACGHDCSRSSYDRAMEHARRICRALGKGWKPAVHENLGWHCSVRRGEVRVTLSSCSGSKPRYFVQTDERGILGEGTTVQAAIRNMQENLNREAVATRRVLDLVERALAENA